MSAHGLLQAAQVVCLGLVCAAGAQSTIEYAPTISLPADRVVDSYAIYSQLLPSNVIEWGNVPRSQWLVEEATHAEPLGRACTSEDSMNPHEGIRAPESRRAEFAEVLADFDAHCHVRYELDPRAFHLELPVRLLNARDRDRFVQGVAGYRPPSNAIMQAPATPDEFKGAAGMHSFTAVYFNAAHTLAMTEIGMYCGGLCGQWSWVVLERTPAGWHALPWVYATMMS